MRVHVEYQKSYSYGGVVLLTDEEWANYLDWLGSDAHSLIKLKDFLGSTREGDAWWAYRLVDETKSFTPEITALKVTKLTEEDEE